MASRLAWCMCSLSLLLGCNGQEAKKNVVVDHLSLQGPFISEWWQGGLPHWRFGGSAVVTDKFIRVVPDKQSRVGWIWADQPCYLNQWEATLTMRIHSRHNPGADGLALWYTEKPVKYNPTNKDHEDQLKLWGMASDFKGMGIIFDTYDNDGTRDSPVVTVIQGVGDANQKWDVDNDLSANSKLRCVYEYRNTGPGDNVKVRIVYANKALQIYLSVDHDPRETFCGVAPDFQLTPGYFFGITATTGHLADNHDVYGFVVTAPEDAVKESEERLYAAPHVPTNE